MVRQKKSTKKFESKQLKKVLALRPLRKKFAAQAQKKEKKALQWERDQKHRKEAAQQRKEEEKQLLQEEAGHRKKALADLSVDEFMEGGFQDALEADSDYEDDNREEKGEVGEDDEDEEGGVEDDDAEGEASADGVDDENEEAGEDDEVNNTLKDEISTHRAELEALKKRDPTFYKYLMENDKSLLEFGELDMDDREAGENLEEGEEAPEDEEEDMQGGKVVGVKMPLGTGYWNKVADRMRKLDLKAVNSFLDIFASAVFSDSDDTRQCPYRINDPTLFNDVLTFATDEFPGLVEKFMKQLAGGKQSNAKSVAARPGWSEVRDMVYAFLEGVRHLVETANDPEMSLYLVDSLVDLIPFIVTSKIHSKKFLKALLDVYANNSGDVSQRAFEIIRELAVLCPFPFINLCLKGIFLAYKSISNDVNERNYLKLKATTEHVVELYGLDFNCSYQHAFVYIRDLALKLRSALQSGANAVEHRRRVLSFSYIYSLRLWSEVVTAYPTQLGELLYPLVQLIQGTATLIPSLQFIPLRLACANMLNRLAQAGGNNTFINSSPIVMDIIQSSLFKAPYSKTTDHSLKLPLLLRARAGVVKTRQYQEAVAAQCTETLLGCLSSFSYSIAFPEVVLPVVLMLRSFPQELKNPKIAKSITSLLDVIERNSEFVLTLRDSSTLTPAQTTQVNTFAPPETKQENKMHNNTKKSPLSVYYEKMLVQSLKQLNEDIKTEQKRVDEAEEEDEEDDDDVFMTQREIEEKIAAKKHAKGLQVEEKQLAKRGKFMGDKERKEKAEVRSARWNEERNDSRKRADKRKKQLNKEKENIVTEEYESEDDATIERKQYDSDDMM